MLEPVLSERELEALREFDTCTVSNAIETFGVRLRNTGYTDSSLRCMFEDLPPLVGYAATARLRTEDVPIDRGRPQDRSEWWRSILAIPTPRIVVLQDMDKPPGRGAFVGDVHAAMLQSLGCIGYVTNGAVRELPQVRDLGFQLFAGNVTVSHSYAHMFHFGAPVVVGELEIHPGDLLHGDRHGVLSVPREVAPQLPAVAARLQERERRLIAMCRAGGMSIEKLREIIRDLE